MAQEIEGVRWTATSEDIFAPTRLSVVSEIPGIATVTIANHVLGVGVSIALTREQTIDLKHFLDYVIGES